MRYTDILWDFNGTILDDVEIGIESVNYLLGQRGKRPISGVDEYRQVFGFPIREYYRRVGFDFDEEPYDIVAPLWVAEYMKRMPRARVYEDVESAARAFRSAGLRQTVLSATKLEMLRDQLEFLGLIRLFDDVLGLDNIKAESKVELARLWRENNRDAKALVIGDTVHDAEVARECGFDCILVPRGHQSREVLADTGFPVMESLSDILDYLKLKG